MVKTKEVTSKSQLIFFLKSQNYNLIFCTIFLVTIAKSAFHDERKMNTHIRIHTYIHEHTHSWNHFFITIIYTGNQKQVFSIKASVLLSKKNSTITNTKLKHLIAAVGKYTDPYFSHFQNKVLKGSTVIIHIHIYIKFLNDLLNISSRLKIRSSHKFSKSKCSLFH